MSLGLHGLTMKTTTVTVHLVFLVDEALEWMVLACLFGHGYSVWQEQAHAFENPQKARVAVLAEYRPYFVKEKYLNNFRFTFCP